MSPRTIAAIATPPGQGGVGIVRLSGPLSRDIALALSGRRHLAPRYCHFVTFRDRHGQPLDQGLVIYFPGPHSFTGEDMAELHGHGGPAVLAGLLAAVREAGAEDAGPGEFTQRAYLNDRLDLSQAEAVASLIEADHGSAARAALRSLDGEMGRLVNDLDEALTELRVFVEGALDFPDEDVDWLGEGQILERLDDLLGRLDRLRERTAGGVRLGRGYRVVLTGRPNAGKSSLLNALAGREAAIVTERGGTTRDVLRESVEIAGTPVELTDTAGLRDAEDWVEQEGVRRARETFHSADVVVFLVDAAVGWTEEDFGQWQRLPPERRHWLWSKADRIAGGVEEGGVSAVCEGGLEPLTELLRTQLLDAEPQDALGARERHLEVLDRVRGHLEAGREAFAGHVSGDLVAQDLRWAQEALGEITGRLHSDDLLGRVFATFCIGK